MTDITDQEKRVLREWANENQLRDEETHLAARYILATVEAPAPSLAEELRDMLEARDREDPTSFSGLLARVEQVEQERDEAKKERDHFFREVENVRNWKEGLLNERDEARAEVERLDAVAEDYARRATAALTERDEARAEVERLTAERDRLEAAQYLSDGSAWGGPVREPTVQKGAESNAESIDPADVKPGEAWMVECRGERRTAVKDNYDTVQWCTVNADGRFWPESNASITLVSRLVSAPRVITNPDDLDRLGHRAVILSTDGQADVYQKDSNGEWLDVTSHGYPSRRVIRMENAATVLWEPGA